MSSTVIEIVGTLDLDYRRTEYLEELQKSENLSEPILVELRRQLQRLLQFEQQRPSDSSVAAARTLTDASLYELLRAHELNIARTIQQTLERQKWQMRRIERGPHYVEREPDLEVTVQFGRGSILYKIVITLVEASGPNVAKGALLALATAAIEPVMLEAARRICCAAKSMSSDVSSAVVRSPISDLVGPVAQRVDTTVGVYSTRLAQFAASLSETRFRRIIIGIGLLLLGLCMTNIVALIAVMRRIS
jgi:hypothetical protein